ncbi:MAG: hypothetical protein ACNA7H_08525 [Desulfotignum sp.]
MWTRMGIWCLLLAFFVWVFSSVSSFMQADNFWVDLTLAHLLGNSADAVVTAIPFAPAQKVLQFLVVELPLYGVILGVGTVFLAIGLYMKVRS